MLTKRVLMLACALVLATGAPLAAQETFPAMGAPAAEPVAAAPAATGASSDLPFTNDGANQPVLQTLSPDGVPLDPAAVAATHDAVAAGAEHAEHGEGHKKGLPQFDSTTFSKQIFWLFLTFTFLYVVYSRVTLPKIASVVEDRAARVQADIAKAEALKGDVDAVRGQYEAAIAAAQSDAQKLITGVQTDIKRASEKQDAEFKARAEDAVIALEKKIDVASTRVKGELNDIAAALTVDIAARVAGIKVDAAAAQSAVDGLSSTAKAA